MKKFKVPVKVLRTMLFSALLLNLLCDIANAFYVPGVAPQDFSEGDKIDVRAIKMTSSHTQLPYEYYSLQSPQLPVTTPDYTYHSKCS